MSGPLIAFYVVGATAILASLGVVLVRNVVHAALMLLIALLAVAGIFLLVFAEFLALTQVLIYGGAVTVVTLFAIMLTRTTELRVRLDNRQRPVAAVAAIVVFSLLTATFLASDIPTRATPASVADAASPATSSGFEALGTVLFTQWAIPFEVVSLVLLVALVGAVIFARDA
jgi:NADH-quinone oxidoreductase subunit J